MHFSIIYALYLIHNGMFFSHKMHILAGVQTCNKSKSSGKIFSNIAKFIPLLSKFYGVWKNISFPKKLCIYCYLNNVSDYLKRIKCSSWLDISKNNSWVSKMIVRILEECIIYFNHFTHWTFEMIDIDKREVLGKYSIMKNCFFWENHFFKYRK